MRHRVPTCLRAERRAAPKPARARHDTRRALVASKPAQAGLEPRHSLPSGDRPMYASAEGLQLRAERRAAPKPARIPSGDRPIYPSAEGLQ